jgi:exopolysaccharide biosynthesis polyprenyl glycosylphosphotransferase
VLGEGEVAVSLRRQLRLFKDVHIELVDDDSFAGVLDGSATTADLETLAERVDRLIIAADSIDSETLTRIADYCRDAEAKLGVVSPIAGSGGPGQQLVQVADLAVVDCETWDLSRSTLALKRAFDIAGASLLLFAFAPAMALIALAIKLDSSGPAIFSQLRAGLDGKPFRMHKLRTMDQDAEARLADLVRIDDLVQPMFKLRNDPRVTRIGRFLRRFSLDELPQLVNVLRGEMSFVGPRPEQMPLVERYAPEHRFRLEVKPGMTGPMQIAGRGDLSFDARLAVERDYIEHMSLARDLRIILLTLPVIVRGGGAF